MILKINNKNYKKTEDIKFVKAISIDKSYIYFDGNKYIGYTSYRGEIISILGESKSDFIIILEYKNKYLALSFDDILSDEGVDYEYDINKYIEDLINV